MAKAQGPTRGSGQSHDRDQTPPAAALAAGEQQQGQDRRGSGSGSDARSACLLCRRVFRNAAGLEKHVAESAMHAENLKNREAKAAALLVDFFSKLGSLSF